MFFAYLNRGSNLFNTCLQLTYMSRFIKKSLITAWPGRRLTHLSLASLLWDICKQDSPRCDAAERGIPSGTILFA